MRPNCLRFAGLILLVYLFSVLPTPLAQRVEKNDNGPRFRGLNASGVAHEQAHPPIEFSVEKNLRWKMLMAEGHSSPCIWEDKIVVTGGIRKKRKLQTLCIDRMNGQIPFQARRIGSGPCFASPTTANGHPDMSANKGVITTIGAANELKIIQINDIDEPISATKATVGDSIYLRTTDRLYLFGNDKPF